MQVLRWWHTDHEVSIDFRSKDGCICVCRCREGSSPYALGGWRYPDGTCKEAWATSPEIRSLLVSMLLLLVSNGPCACPFKKSKDRKSSGPQKSTRWWYLWEIVIADFARCAFVSPYLRSSFDMRNFSSEKSDSYLNLKVPFDEPLQLSTSLSQISCNLLRKAWNETKSTHSHHLGTFETNR